MDGIWAVLIPRLNLAASAFTERGFPYMTFAQFWDLLTPSPLVTYRNQLTLFLSSAFWGPPPPPSADIIYGSPAGDRMLFFRRPSWESLLSAICALAASQEMVKTASPLVIA